MSITNLSTFQIVQFNVPHISKNLEALWGTVEFEQYICHIMLDTREGTREGFPIMVGRALLILLNQHGAEFPYLYNNNSDVWVTNHRTF